MKITGSCPVEESSKPSRIGTIDSIASVTIRPYELRLEKNGDQDKVAPILEITTRLIQYVRQRSPEKLCQASVITSKSYEPELIKYCRAL